MKNIIIILFCLSDIIFAQGILTLDESIKLCLKNNYNIRIAESKISEAEAGYNEISSQFLPKLTFNAGYTRLSEIDPFQIKLPVMPAPVTIQEAILNNYTVKATLNQPIFTGFRLSAQKKALEHIKNAQVNEFNNEVNNSVFQTAQVFYNLYKVVKSKDVLLKRQESVKNHYNNAKDYFANGLATKNDLLRLEVLQSDIKIKLLENENLIKTTKNILRKLIVTDINTEIDIDTTVIQADELFIENNLITEAMENRDDLKSANELISYTHENVRVANSEYFPTISGFASYNYDRPNQRLMPLKDEFKETWAVGVNLSWELWNWGGTSARKEKAVEKGKQAGLVKNNLIESIKNEVTNNYYEYETGRKKVELYKLQTIQAEENLREVKTKYNEQLSTITDLIDAETVLMDAQNKWIFAKADEQIAKLKLYKSLGRKLY